MKVISVLLVDDHTLFRQGLASVLKDRPNYQVVGHAANGLEAIDLARQLMPDLILMDVHMPVLNGLEATRQIKREMPDVRIVMLTMSEDDQNLFEAIKSGAQGYLLKNTAADELFRFMAGVLEGEASVSGIMAAKMLGEFRKPKTISSEVTGNEQLTDREREVLSHVAEGLSNREIAANLQVSENTIKKHLRNILAKLQLENRVQAALYAKSRS